MRRRPLLLFLFLGLIVAPALAQGDPDAGSKTETEAPVPNFSQTSLTTRMSSGQKPYQKKPVSGPGTP